jgi:hypothetical protein
MDAPDRFWYTEASKERLLTILSLAFESCDMSDCMTWLKFGFRANERQDPVGMVGRIGFHVDPIR